MNQKVIKYINKNFHENVEGKTIVITGSNSGIGLFSARIALYLKMNVIIAVRNLTKGEEAVNKLKEEFPNSNIRLMQVDMSEEASIINFVNSIKKDKIDIDVFYHNAGIYRFPYQIKENKELVVSTNYYGPFMLTSLLLPYLHSLNHEVRMIFTSSIAAKFADNDLSILTPSKVSSRTKRYSNSKLLDAHLAHYLYKNDKNNIKYYLVHPGVTATELFNKTYKNKLYIFFRKSFIKLFANPLWKSALSFLLTLKGDAKEGALYGPNKLFNILGYPKENHFLDHIYSNNDDIIKKSKDIIKYELPNN